MMQKYSALEESRIKNCKRVLALAHPLKSERYRAELAWALAKDNTQIHEAFRVASQW